MRDQLNEALVSKWKDVLDHPELAPIKDPYRKAVTAILLENTIKDARDQQQMMSGQLLTEAAPTNATSGISNFDPILISLVRRAAPNLVAYDVCGVQPMTGPTGLIFALRARYGGQSNGGSNPETFYNEVNTAFSAPNTAAANTQVVGGAGLNLGTAPSGNAQVYNYQQAIPTGDAEALGGNTSYVFPELAFSIEKVTVTAQSRALKAEYSMEMAQDLKAIHGLDAESELSNMLSTEMLAEINREVVRLINLSASAGASEGTTLAGTFDLDTDSNGRWSVEKFKGLMFQIEREANKIAKNTRRGKGNIVLCSSDVASALGMAGILSFTPALDSNQINPDDTGVTFVGVLNNRMRVYIDPYSVEHYMTVGYKGASPFDAGIFYCPYVPLQMVRAVDPNSFQPKIGFKTRYGMVANPFAEGLTQGFGRLAQNSNLFYRRVLVNNLL